MAKQVTKRYIVANTYIWEGGEDATISYYEISKKHYNMLKVNNGSTVFDVDYEQPWAQFKQVVVNGNELDEGDAEKLLNFGSEGIIATFASLADLFAAISGSDVSFIEVTETTE